MLDFQFHINRLNSVEKIGDEKKESIHPQAHNEKIALFGLWARLHVIFGKTITAKIQPK